MPVESSQEPGNRSLTDRVIRVFISSTFRDMQAERDHLVKFIFPQLRKLCESRGVTWGEVDLRWGVTDEQAAEGKVLPICLEEIKRCRPYFIGLLSERYGWIPETLPPGLVEREKWLEEHLHGKTSVTELEILHGVLRNPKMAGHAYFYFRDPAFVNSVPEKDRKDFTAKNAKNAEKLRHLKENIRHSGFPVRENYPDPNALGEFVLADLTKVINDNWPEGSQPDPLDREAMDHEAYAQSRERVYIGRQQYFDRLDNYANCNVPRPPERERVAEGRVRVEGEEQVLAGGEVGNDNKPLVILGESGSGKSALLANWVARYRQAHPDALVLQHYIGATPYSADWAAMLRRLMGEFKRRLGIQQDIPDQPGALRSAFPNWLYMAAAEGRVVLVLDALNQLEDRDGAPDLVWLPPVLPENVRLIVSTLPGRSLDEIQKRNWPTLKVELLSADERRKLIAEYLAQHAKSLNAARVERIAAALPSANPLYLRVLLNELRLIRTHEELEERIGDYLKAESPYALYEKVIARWEQDYGQELVRQSLCLTGAARRGLSEAELLDLLGKDSLPLPRAQWTPFYLAAENAIVLRSGLLNFGHDYLRAFVQNGYLNNPALLRTYRLQLAEYFTKSVEPTKRKLDELPKLLCDLEQWENLKHLLGDIDTFMAMESDYRLKWELQGYWLKLKAYSDPLPVYEQAVATYSKMAKNPLRVAQVQMGLGLFFSHWVNYSVAESFMRLASKGHEQALGLEHPHTLLNLNNLGFLLSEKGDYANAEPILRRVLEAQDRHFGPEHCDTLWSTHELALLLYRKGDYVSAEPLYRRVLEVREKLFGPEHPDTLSSIHEWGFVLSRKGDYTGAEAFFRRALRARESVLGTHHPDTLQSINSLAACFMERGEIANAEPLLRHALETRERGLGREHPDTLVSVNNLAVLLESKSDYAGAEPLYRRALEAQERILGSEHPTTLASMNNLAKLLLESKRDPATAESLIRRSLEAHERVLGSTHLDTLLSMRNLTVLLISKGDQVGAEPVLRRAMEMHERSLGHEHPDTLSLLNKLAHLLYIKGDSAGAEPLFRRALAARERVLGPQHPDTLVSVNNLAHLLDGKGNYAGAEPLFRRALAAREKVLGFEHLDTLLSVHSLANLLNRKGDQTGAEPLYRRALDGYERAQGPEHPDTLLNVRSLAGLLFAKRDIGGAEPFFRRVLAASERALGPEHPDTLLELNNLAAVLKCKGDYMSAEPLCQRALQGLLQVSVSTGQPHANLDAFVTNYAGLLKRMGRSDPQVLAQLNAVARPFGIQFGD